MSDLSAVRQKVQEGADWRGTIRVSIQGEEHELTVRQLTDDEFWEVMSLISREEIQALRDELPADLLEEYQELQRAEDLDEEGQERIEEVREELNEEAPDITDVLSTETFHGIQRCAKKAVVPDEEDLRMAFAERAPEIESEYGVTVKTPEDVRPALQDEIETMIDNATNFTSFTIGMQALFQTVGDEGNLEP